MKLKPCDKCKSLFDAIDKATAKLLNRILFIIVFMAVVCFYTGWMIGSDR